MEHTPFIKWTSLDLKDLPRQLRAAASGAEASGRVGQNGDASGAHAMSSKAGTARLSGARFLQRAMSGPLKSSNGRSQIQGTEQAGGTVVVFPPSKHVELLVLTLVGGLGVD